MTDDLLQKIRNKGEQILDNIDASDTIKSKELDKEGSAPRSYYSVSKVLLDVLDLELKQGKAGEKEIAEKLGKYQARNLPVRKFLQSRELPNSELPKQFKQELRQLLELAEKKQKEIAQWSSVNPGDLKDLVDIIGKILQIVIAALAVYHGVKAGKNVTKRVKKPSRKNTKRKTSE